MAKVAKQTVSLDTGKKIASHWINNPQADLTSIYASVGEFVCRATQLEQNGKLSAKARARRIVEMALEANEKLDEIEASISCTAAPHPKKVAVDTSDSRESSQTTARTTALSERNCENEAKLAAIGSARGLLMRSQLGKFQRKETVGVRIMDTVLGSIFVIGLLVWTYVLRLFRAV